MSRGSSLLFYPLVVEAAQLPDRERLPAGLGPVEAKEAGAPGGPVLPKALGAGRGPQRRAGRLTSKQGGMGCSERLSSPSCPGHALPSPRPGLMFSLAVAALPARWRETDLDHSVKTAGSVRAALRRLQGEGGDLKYLLRARFICGCWGMKQPNCELVWRRRPKAGTQNPETLCHCLAV